MTTETREHVRRWRKRLIFSVRGRATVITVAVSALILVLASVLLMLLARDWTVNRASQKAERTVERIVSDIVRGRDGEILATRAGETPMVQVVSPDGRVVAAGPAIRGRPALARSDLAKGKLLVHREACPDFLDECVRIFGIRARTSQWGPGVTVVAASPLPSLLNVWLLPLGIALVLLALLALIAWWTWHTIGQAFAPFDRIRSEMADVSARDLAQRVSVPQFGGEIQPLAETVNATLERLEEATNRERRFISDASHDLRNPLAGLQMQLESALDEPDESDWKPMVRSALRDTERLNDIVIDLLELSRLDSRAPMPVERIDLAGLARREVERRPPGLPIRMNLESGVTVHANTVRLQRVLGNLLNNAGRHAETRIELTVTRDDGDAVLEVLDDGSGVPEESRERVFERFARLSESRTRDPQGTGLGLPIAREIAEVYGGSLRIADSRKGARFVLRLPLADRP